MKKIVFTIWAVVSLLCPFVSNAQSQYENVKVIQYANEEYQIDYRGTFCKIQNSRNTLLNQVIRKVDSGECYNEGSNVVAQIDVEAIVEEIERKIFSGLEWDDYTNNPGMIIVDMAINPSDGRVLEVGFNLETQAGWGTPPAKSWADVIINPNIFKIQIGQLYSIEHLLKEKVVGHLSEETNHLNLSYVRAELFLFENWDVLPHYQ